MPSEVSTVNGDHSVEALRRELAEAREQQAATRAILGAISNSPTDSVRVFAEIAASAARLCDGYNAGIFRLDGEALRLVAHYGPISAVGPIGEGTLPLTRGLPPARAVLERQTFHVADLQAETTEYPEGSDFARRLGFHAALAVPLIRAKEAIGVITIRRTDARPFTDQQVDLLKTFADQAVIAIENTRLFEAEQASKRELQESLEYQAAIGDVLGVISRSPNQLQPVFDAIVRIASKLCEAENSGFALRDGDAFRLVADDVPEGPYKEFLRGRVFLPVRGSMIGRAAYEKRLVHVPDQLADPDFTEFENQRVGGARTVLAAPLIKDDHVVGVISMMRRVVRPFSERQVKLLETFADQALIAIENTRLFEEVQVRNRDLTEALDRQTATAEILQVISSSPTQVEPVFNAILRRAISLCDALFGVIYRFDGELIHVEAHHNFTIGAAGLLLSHYPSAPGRTTVSSRAILERTIIQAEDATDESQPSLAATVDRTR